MSSGWCDREGRREVAEQVVEVEAGVEWCGVVWCGAVRCGAVVVCGRWRRATF